MEKLQVKISCLPGEEKWLKEVVLRTSHGLIPSSNLGRLLWLLQILIIGFQACWVHPKYHLEGFISTSSDGIQWKDKLICKTIHTFIILKNALWYKVTRSHILAGSHPGWFSISLHYQPQWVHCSMAQLAAGTDLTSTRSVGDYLFLNFQGKKHFHFSCSHLFSNFDFLI